jgi:hypothetical protein
MSLTELVDALNDLGPFFPGAFVQALVNEEEFVPIVSVTQEGSLVFLNLMPRPGLRAGALVQQLKQFDPNVRVTVKGDRSVPFGPIWASVVNVGTDSNGSAVLFLSDNIAPLPPC